MHLLQVGLANMTTFYNNGRYKIVGGPPPSSGSVIAFMLNMLDRVNIRDPSMDYGQRYHYILEALKFGFATRMGLGDLPFIR
jgi:gamma-glutamyltranspeptidase